jgi:hypothetical protein
LWRRYRLWSWIPVIDKPEIDDVVDNRDIRSTAVVHHQALSRGVEIVRPSHDGGDAGV